jgi:hypothetical protein
MFEPAVAAANGVTRGLVFVNTDHGFNLGHDPAIERPADGLFVARLHADGHDRRLYERLGQPPTFRYHYDTQGQRPPRLEPFVPPVSSRFEAEAEWPALLERGRAYPLHHPCASAGRALRLTAGTRLRLRVRQLGATPGEPAALEVGWVSTGPAGSEIRVQVDDSTPMTFQATGEGCSVWRLAGQQAGGAGWAHIELVRGEGALDFLTLVTR